MNIADQISQLLVAAMLVPLAVALVPPLFLIGIPATLIPVYVWVRFARTPKGRR
jgi:hypothetical protein